MGSTRRFVPAALVALAVTGCSWRTIQAKSVSLPGQIEFMPLRRSDYRVLHTATGSAKAGVVLLFPLPIWRYFGDKDYYVPQWRSMSHVKGLLTRRAVMAAIYNALDESGEGDMLLEPRVELEVRTVGPWFRVVEATVTGKVISIKTD